MGENYTAWHVDFQKSPNYPSVDASRSGVMTLTPGWGGFSGTFSNMKVFQTVTLPAGSYEFIALRAQDWEGADNSYLVVGKGNTIPDIENFSTALASAKFSTAVAPEWEVITTFALQEETQVSLGAVASFDNAKSCVTLAEFKLMYIEGLNLRSLSALIERYQAYNTTQYPVLGTYAEQHWNSLQAAIALAQGFLELGEEATQEGLDAEMLSLQTAATALDSMARLPKLVANVKTYNNTQYPIGTVMGTYPQAKWDALQAAILVAQTFIETTTVSAEDIETNTAALNLAIDDLNGSMVLPFKVSDEAKSYWYQIRDMRDPMNFMQIGEYSKFSDDGLSDIYLSTALIITQEDNNFDDQQLFKITKAPAPLKGYHIYNKLMEDIPLSLIDSLGMLQVNTEMEELDSTVVAWQFGATKSALNYTIFIDGKIRSQLNSFNGYEPPYVGFYYPGAGAHDNGNAWEFVERIESDQTDFRDLIALLATASRMTSVQYPIGTAESEYPAASWGAFVAVRTLAITLVARELDEVQPEQSEVDEMILTLQTAIDELRAAQNDAFFVSDETTQHWYTLNDNRAVKSYWKIGAMEIEVDESNPEVPITTSSNKLMMVKGKPATITDSLVFKLVKAEEPYLGYHIYSKVDNVNPITGDVGANFIGINAELENLTWVFEKSTLANHYIIFTEETLDEMNSYAEADFPFIGFWNGGAADPGNNWRFTAATPTTAVESVKVSDLKVYVVNRMIVAANPDAKLTVYNLRGQKVDSNRQLTQGVYIVRADGNQKAVKVIVY